MSPLDPMTIRHKWRSLKQTATTKLSRTSRTVQFAHKNTVHGATEIETSLSGVSKAQILRSPCPHLLLSNQTPTESEAKLVAEAIENAQGEAIHLIETLDQNQSKNDTPRNHARELKTTQKLAQVNLFIHQHQGIVSAIRRLPTEILQEIFTRCTHYASKEAIYYRIHEHLRPWAFSQTSHFWRTTALHIPSLWNYLPSIRLERSHKTTRLQMEYLHEMLRRSSGTLLDICVDGSHFDQADHPTIALLSQHAERWETAAIVMDKQFLSGLRRIQNRLTSLKSLSFSAITLPINVSADIDFFITAPLLTTVNLARPISRNASMPYTQLIHYKENINDDHQLTPAIHSPVLETLALLIHGRSITFPLLTIPRLVELYVKSPYLLDDLACFDNLTLPSIRDIRISSYENLTPTLTKLLTNSFPCSALKTLAIQFNSIEPNELTNLLLLTPELVHLHATLPAPLPGSASEVDIDILNLAGEGAFLNQPLVPLLETCEFYSHNEDYARTKIASSSFALNRLASIRCEPENNNAARACSPGEVRRLKSLSISVSGPKSSRLQLHHNSLEVWWLRSSMLAHWHPHLVAKLSDREKTGMYGIWRWAENDKVEGVLAKIDGVEVKHARDICITGVQCTLKKIATCNSYATRNRELAGKILDKWKPMLEDPAFLKRRHWALQGDRTLVYIPNDSDLRISPENIIFGVKDDRPETFFIWNV